MANYTTIGLSELKVGVKVRLPIYDPTADNDVLLLGSGSVVTQAQLDILRGRGITKVKVQQSELTRITTGVSKVKRVKKAADLAENSAEAAAFANHFVQHDPTDCYDEAAVDHAEEFFEGSVTQTAQLFESLADGESVNGAAVIQSTNANLSQMADDLDLFVSLGMKPTEDNSLYQHSVQTCRLAVAIGATMKLSQPQLMELGIGCMVHDVGMLKVPKEITTASRVLTAVEFLEIQKHPIYTFEMIKNIPELPQGSRMVAYQMHERWNGSGYPRKRVGKQIHLLARIGGIADEFVAKISPRPYRPGMLPHFAMLEMLRGARSGMFDPEVIKALLHTLSLYPVGSFIELSDGRVGKVIRSNGDEFSSPVVSVWHVGENENMAQVVDLSKTVEEGLTVKTALATLEGLCQDDDFDPLAEMAGGEFPTKSDGQQSFLCNGTFVKLSDGRVACVIQENAQLFSHPIVRAWASDPWAGESEVINLDARGDDLHIEEPIATPIQKIPEGPKKQMSLFGCDDEDDAGEPEPAGNESQPNLFDSVSEAASSVAEPAMA